MPPGRSANPQTRLWLVTYSLRPTGERRSVAAPGRSPAQAFAAARHALDRFHGPGLCTILFARLAPLARPKRPPPPPTLF
jgi:hypothetical protein